MFGFVQNYQTFLKFAILFFTLLAIFSPLMYIMLVVFSIWILLLIDLFLVTHVPFAICFLEKIVTPIRQVEYSKNGRKYDPVI